jgi:hypothetical protein
MVGALEEFVTDFRKMGIKKKNIRLRDEPGENCQD